MRHQSNILNLLTTGLSLAFITAVYLISDFRESVAIWTVLASVFLIGIPHGAIDHVMAAELYNLNRTWLDHLKFYGSYLLIMMAVGLLWFLTPVSGMILFLAISIYHFGQADMEEFTAGRSGNLTEYLARGCMIIGLIIFSEPAVTYPIMAEAMSIEAANFEGFMPDPQIAVLAMILVYSLIIAAGLFRRKFQNPLQLITDSILLILVLTLTGPLIGFALYFALWHSAGHISEMRHFFETRGKQLTLSGFYKKALPFTAVSILGLAFLAGVNHTFGLDEQFLSLMFILISVLTLPHMVIVDRMYKEV
ncbi:MAG: Brp/Blh family beta-carotene 15,15'-dioxygenase [Balneolaceae bacterium]|nr:Brp/Blh family beta-carotene 15,15'-dioxygenase [Balneolaceae bacterium]